MLDLVLNFAIVYTLEVRRIYNFTLLLIFFLKGMKEADRQENLMQKATALIHQSTEEEPGSSRQAEAAQGLSAPAAAVRF